MHHQLEVRECFPVRAEVDGANPMPSENRRVQPLSLVKPAQGLLLPAQLQQLEKEQVKEQPEAQEDVEFLKQRKMLEQMCQELRVMQEQIDQHQEELKQQEAHSKKMHELLEIKEKHLESSSKELKQEWERLRHEREEYLRFEKKQLEQIGRERLEMRRREIFWQERVQEREAAFINMRNEVQKRELHIELRNRHLARREASVAERELAVAQLELNLQETNRLTEKANCTDDVSSAAKSSPFCEGSISEPTVSCSETVQGETAVSKSMEL